MKPPASFLIIPLAFAAISVALLVGTGCKKSEAPATGEAPGVPTLRIGVNPVPHGEILRAEVPEGAQVTIPSDPSNASRALHLLADQGLLRLKETAGAVATVGDVVGNPRKLELREIDAEQQPRTLEDVAAAVINGNYFLEAQKHLKLDAKVLARESSTRNPYANVLVVRKGDESRPEVRVLLKALQSSEVRHFIEAQYGGAVVPAF